MNKEMQKLELGMQELEAMEAPGLWTGIGVGGGAAATYATIYFAVSGAALT